MVSKAIKNPAVTAIKVFISGQPHTRSDLAQAIIEFKDELKNNSVAHSTFKEKRQIGSAYQRGYVHDSRRGSRFGGRDIRGQRGRGRYPGRNYMYGRGQGSIDGMTNSSAVIFIPQEVLQAIPPKYQAMLFKGREQMEKELGNNSPFTKAK